MNQPRNNRPGGFNAIEVIAALAISAFGVLVVAPHLLEAFSDSKVSQAVKLVKSLQNAVAKYGSDLGTIYPLSAVGVATPVGDPQAPEARHNSLADVLVLSKTAPPAASKAGLWRKFDGPYAAPLPTNPPLGTDLILSAVPSVAGTPTTTNATFSLAGNPNAGLPTGSALVFVRFEGVEQREFEKLDSILDPGIGTTPVQKTTLGKVKWDPLTNGLLVYIAHR
jgi:type II secretory pathway pseudopilin PulG